MKNAKNILKDKEEYWENKDEFDWMTTHSIKKIIKNTPPPTGYSLELCSGSGMFTRWMKFRDSKKYICLDLSQSLLNKLKERLKFIETKKGDAQEINFKDKTFNHIYMLDCIIYLN